MFPSNLPLLPLVLDDVPWGLRQMLAQEGIPTVSRDRRGAHGRFLLFDSATGPCHRPTPSQVAVDINRLRSGFSTDPFVQWGESRTSRYQWQIGDYGPTEEICRVDKRSIRQRLMNRLRRLVERRGGVWLGLSPYPYSYRTVFNLRIDYDQFEAGDFERLQQVLEGRQAAVTHFVNGAAYEPHSEALSRLAGLDVGSHGYRHHTYRTFQENLRNIERGIQVLEQARIQPVGFTAPHGRFNRALLAALERLEIPYSSEFAAAYDELPFLPAGSNVLQLPIHPVCLGIVIDAARAKHRGEDTPAVAATLDHFRAVIEAKSSAREPILLYGHPTGRLGRHPELVDGIFQEIEGRREVWRTTMSEWAAWWRARSRTRLQVIRDGEHLVVEVGQDVPRHCLGIEFYRGQEIARLPLNRNRMRISPDAVPFESLGSKPTFQPVRLDQSHGIRGRVRRWIDWERETPVDEIAPTNWRNVAKRTLRTLWR